ncbi:YihY/virulence factor BrkB family protein [Lacisediminihabitans changchengi]|uniref:YihY/virulence factor BrkB family protein n=1 Tax=Lacisediminihabitans changchengi TaxID=2787634 RepID=A0A934SVM4_9MICO|nr:YihY/virulence factor BrkB family protein [Lacisediminihabitans changchengi]MBK4348854.1 YihY/virulence factor BrkB family protein [Lacisediminihabitans changchengi]
MKSVIATIRLLVKHIMAWRAVRVFQLYSQRNGPILAGGLSLTALYSVFAALYVGFAVLGLVIESDPGFKDAVVSTLSTSVPGLIDTGNGAGGAIKLDALFTSRILGWSGIVALVAVLVTALSWFASARSAVRHFFELPPDKTFFLLLKAKDLGLVIAFGAVTLFSAGLSIFSTSALGFLFDLIGIDRESGFATVVARIIGLIIALAIDTAVLAALFRVLAATRIPPRRLLLGALLGGIGLGVLKVLGATIVGGGSKNPLLASFAVLLGLLIWFGLICQVILLTATWIAVDVKDHGETITPKPATTSVRRPPEHHRPRARAVSPPG